MAEPVKRATPRLAPRRRRRWLRLLVLLLIVGLVVFGVWAVWFSSWLTAQQVRVVGAEGARAEAVLAAAAVPVGQPLARIDTQGAQGRVTGLPWVAQADVRRGWPSEVVIAVTAREPVAVLIGTPGGPREVVDAEGVTFEPVAALPKALPKVAASGDALTEAMTVLVGLPPDLAKKVVEVRATTHDNVTLKLRSGDRVRWGSADQAEYKAEVLRALLRRKADVYDVTAPEMPTTYRSGT